MTKWNLLLLLAFTCLFCELLVGSFGVLFPLTAFMVFYVTVTYGWRVAVVTAFICGVFIDQLFLRPILITPFSLILVSFVALFWLYRVESEDLLLHMIPGAVIPVIYLCPLLVIQQFVGGINVMEFIRSSANVIFCFISGAVLLPLFIVGIDCLGETLELDLYADAKSKLAERDAL